MAEGWDVFPQALQRSRDAVAADPDSTRWGTRLFVVDEPRTLVGLGGFKGPPRDGVIEIGYAVAPSWEGRGIATTATRELLREAFTSPGLRAVIAHTLPRPGASVRVLEKTGFVPTARSPTKTSGPPGASGWIFDPERRPAASKNCSYEGVDPKVTPPWALGGIRPLRGPGGRTGDRSSRGA